MPQTMPCKTLQACQSLLQGQTSDGAYSVRHKQLGTVRLGFSKAFRARKASLIDRDVPGRAVLAAGIVSVRRRNDTSCQRSPYCSLMRRPC